MIFGDLPPNSSVILLQLLLPAACIINFPTFVLPVNATLLIFICDEIASPAVAPNPGMTLTTPRGKPASRISDAIYNAVNGVCSAGFNTIQQPHARAGANFHATINAGKFQGVIWPTIPIGS